MVGTYTIYNTQYCGFCHRPKHSGVCYDLYEFRESMKRAEKAMLNELREGGGEVGPGSNEAEVGPGNSEVVKGVGPVAGSLEGEPDGR